MKTKLLKKYRRRFKIIRHGLGYAIVDKQTNKIVLRPLTGSGFEHFQTALLFCVAQLTSAGEFADLLDNKHQRLYTKTAVERQVWNLNKELALTKNFVKILTCVTFVVICHNMLGIFTGWLPFVVITSLVLTLIATLIHLASTIGELEILNQFK